MQDSDARGSQDPCTALRPTGGRDELNLAEFPITLLSNRAPEGCKTLVFQDEVYDQQAGQMVTRKLTVTGSDAYGLPTALDDEILVALLQLTKRANSFSEPRVSFSRYELLKLLGWTDCGENYHRVEESLNRWLGVSLYYEKAWWDKEDQCWVDAKFHILESVVVLDPSQRRRLRQQGRQGLALSSFKWNDIVFRSFQADNLKRLDLETYFALNSAVSKRMFRFLDKRFYHRRRWEFDLREFACEHIGLSRTYNVGQIKVKLQPALDELTAVGFLEPLGRAERYAKVGRGDWRIIVIQKSPKAEGKPRKVQRLASELEKELEARGVTPATAAALVETVPSERIRLKLEVFDWLVARRDRRITKSPAGYLVKSIEDDYAAPQGFESRADRIRREEAERQEQQKEAEQLRRRKAEQAREAAEHAKVTKYWNALSVEEQARLEADALGQAEESLAKSYREMRANNNPLAASFFRIIRDAYIRRLLNIGGTA
jgi:Replication initiator protein A